MGKLREFVRLEGVDFAGVDAGGEIFEGGILRDDEVHFVEGREKRDQVAALEVDDEVGIGTGKTADGEEEVGGHFSLVDGEESVAAVLEDLLEGVGVAIIEDFGLGIKFEEAAGHFGKSDLDATEAFDRKAGGDVGEVDRRSHVELIGHSEAECCENGVPCTGDILDLTRADREVSASLFVENRDPRFRAGNEKCLNFGLSK